MVNATAPPQFVAVLGFFVVALDAQIVNVALPAIGDGMGGCPGCGGW